MDTIIFLKALLAEATTAEKRLDGIEALAYNRGYRDALSEAIEYAEEQEDQ